MENNDEKPKDVILDKEDKVLKKFLIIYNTRHTKIQSILFPDTYDQYNIGVITTLIELTEKIVYQGENKWIKIPEVEYNQKVTDKET